MTDVATAVEFLQQTFGRATTRPVYISSLPNADARGSQPGERRILSRNSTAVEQFVQSWDRAGRGVFFCVSTLQHSRADPGRSPRCKANIAEIALLHVDVDLKSVEPGTGDIIRELAALPLPPSIVVLSGNGVHAYWLLKKVAGPKEALRVEAVLRGLADLVGGDPAVAEVSRLMRLPGTHNTKAGTWTPVTIHQATYDRRYELDDLEDMVGSCQPRIGRKSPAISRLNGTSNHFASLATQFAPCAAIDIEQRLAGMAHQGPGHSSIHQTHLQVSASLLSRGHSVDHVTAVLMEATKRAAGQKGSGWDWTQEEQAIRRMCADWLRKKAASGVGDPNGLAHADDNSEDKPVSGGNGQPKSKSSGVSLHRSSKALDTNVLPNIVADAVVDAVRQDKHDILLTDGNVFIYDRGVWRVMAAAEEQWLKILIQKEFERFTGSAKLGQLAAAWKRITEHPKLYKPAVPWANGGLIATADGMLDVLSRNLFPHSPAHYARRKIGALYAPAAECPQFLAFLNRLFSDRDPTEAAACISVLQCFFGGSLAVALLSREERKALILLGPSRTGKTELARFIRLLVGEPTATPSVAEISERFGLSSLYEASAWIRDDAINEGDNLDPQRFKTVVTGEPIDIERKHRDSLRGVELAIPVVLTANALPHARDKSDALFNRSLVLELTNVISEAEAFQFRTDLGVPRGQTVRLLSSASKGLGS